MATLTLRPNYNVRINPSFFASRFFHAIHKSFHPFSKFSSELTRIQKNSDTIDVSTLSDEAKAFVTSLGGIKEAADFVETIGPHYVEEFVTGLGGLYQTEKFINQLNNVHLVTEFCEVMGRDRKSIRKFVHSMGGLDGAISFLKTTGSAHKAKDLIEFMGSAKKARTFIENSDDNRIKQILDSIHGIETSHQFVDDMGNIANVERFLANMNDKQYSRHFLTAMNSFENAQRFVTSLAGKQARVYLCDDGKRRTGRLLTLPIAGGTFPTLNATVPVSIAALAILLQWQGEEAEAAITNLAQAQPQNTAKFFARARSTTALSEANRVDLTRCRTLMDAWAKEFADIHIEDGVVRNTLLSSGAELFTSFLTNIDLGSKLKHEDTNSIDKKFKFVAHRSNQSECKTVNHGNLKNNIKSDLGGLPVCLDQVLDLFISFKLLDFSNKSEYTAAIVSMIVAGTVIYSREQVAKDQQSAKNEKTVLSLAGTIMNYIPISGSSVIVSVGSAMIDAFSNAQIAIDQSLESSARQFADAMILDRRNGDQHEIGTTDFGSIILAALNGVTLR